MLAQVSCYIFKTCIQPLFPRLSNEFASWLACLRDDRLFQRNLHRLSIFGFFLDIFFYCFTVGLLELINQWRCLKVLPQGRSYRMIVVLRVFRTFPSSGNLKYVLRRVIQYLSQIELGSWIYLHICNNKIWKLNRNGIL